MPWTELTHSRTPTSRTYHDGHLHRCCASQATIHYQADQPIDLTPARITVPQFDGWRVTANDWHYALGHPATKATDGWVGFGGRQGAHWFQSRLARVGYLHWPTRTWQDVGGEPNYDRANLEQLTRSLTIGPNADQIAAETIATWHDLWSTPGGGAVSASWKIRGRHLKEEIVLDRAAREWITANHPPATPANETWFGLVFHVDWTDVPKIVRDGAQLSPDDDFADDPAGIQMHDALDRLLGFLPHGHAHIRDTNARQSAPLRKRFWKADRNYLLAGLRCDTLAALPDGHLALDPTVTPRVAADNDECLTYPVSQLELGPASLFIGNDGGWNHVGIRWQLNLPAAATIVSSKITFTADDNLSTDTVHTTIKYEDINDPANFSGDNYATFEARTRSAASTDWDFTTNWTTDTEYDTDDISTVIQALVDEAYWAANEHCVLFVEDDSSDNNAHRSAYGHNASAAKAALLTVDYTTGSPAAAAHHYRLRRA